MKKYILLSIAVMALASTVFLETAGTALAAKGIIKTPVTGGDSMSNIAVSDLGVQNPGILPTSRLYFLKEWSRDISRFFTFNSVAKAELELKIANEKAVEALKVQEAKPDDAEALAIALENYTKAQEQLQARLVKLKETSENPNVERLLEKLNEQTLKHAILFNQFVKIRDTDSPPDDGGVINPQAARDNNLLEQRDNRLQGAVDVIQKKIQDIVLTAAQKDKNIEQKSGEQIQRADVAIHEFESELSKLKSGFIHSSQTQSAKFAINEPGVPNNKKAINTKGTGAVARTASEPGVSNEKTGPIRLDPTPARISTNLTIERQTPKKDFGDRMKAGLDTAGGTLANAKAHLDFAKTAFAEGKFGEAFGEARSAEVLARNGLRKISNDVKKLIREGTDADAPRIEDINSAMPIVPGTGKAGEKIVPEAEKRVFPETNNRVFPETNNRTVCDDRQAPGCLRGEILECHNGKWVCIGPASGAKEGQILPITPTPISAPTTIAPTIYEFKFEADDSGFYPEPTIIIPKGSRVKLHFIVRSAGVYYGGLEFRGSKF